ncbi:MAG: caspase family protein [Planctomyces sp.]|nr:caspase family protein [Planctomyces sp.]
MSIRVPALSVILAINAVLCFPNNSIADVWCSSGGKYVAFCARGDDSLVDVVSVWEFHTGKEKCRISHGPDAIIEPVSISESSSLVATAIRNDNKDPGVSIWDLNTGEKLWNDSHAEYGTKCRAIAFTPDGRQILTLMDPLSGPTTILVRQSSDGEVLRTIEDAGLQNIAAAFSPTGEYVYAYVRSEEQHNCMLIRCWDVNTGKIVVNFRFSEDEESTYEYGNFAVGAEFIVQEVEVNGSSGRRTMMVVWDATQRTEIRRIDTNFAYMDRGTISLFEERDSVFVTWGDVCREYNLHTGEKVSEFSIPVRLCTKEQKTIVPMPHSSALLWSSNARGAPGGQLVLGVSKYQRGTHRTIAATFQALEKRKDSAVVLANTKVGVVTGSPEWVVTPRVNRVQDGEQLWDNDYSSLKEIRHEPAAVKKLLVELSTPVPGRESKRIDRSKPRLFILGVGVSDHELDEKDLVYAASDARSLVEKFEALHGSVYGDVQVKLYEDKRVTPDSVRDGLNWLAQSSTERDVVVLFFSGHGMRGRKGLYYFTHHGDEENLQNTCVNWSDVAKSLAATKASQILFLSDCCHAGAFSKDHFLNQADLAKAIDSVENVAILASCTGEEGSLELDEFKHGAFTQAVLEALDGAGDVDGDGNSTWSEILDYVLVRVPKITGNEQHPIELKSAKSPKTLILSTKEPAAAVKPPTSKAVVSPRK